MVNREKIYFIVLGLILGGFLLSTHKQWHQARSFSDEILRRAWEYIETLSPVPQESLSTEQKLLLLHAHYVVQNYDQVLGISRQMTEELQQLPPERRQAFHGMIQDAYQKSRAGTG